MEIRANHGNVLEKTKAAYENGKKVIIHKGGTGSGKTFDIMIFCFWLLCEKIENKVITVVSESKPHLDIGCIRYAKMFTNNPLGDVVRYNESKSFFTFPGNNILEFFSADRIDKALGARRFMLYGNEINSLKLHVWDELARRSEIIVADFNPTSEFWLERWLKYYDHTEVILSNHTDNPYLPDTERARIVKRAQMDSNFRRIHIDCEYGVSEGLVFEDWNQVDEMPEISRRIGLDFGYTNDPTAVIDVRVKGENIFLDELIYTTNLTNPEIVAKMKQVGITPGYDELIADSAEPKSIEEIYRAGFNVKASVKGADSIRAGIDRIKQYNIHITKRSTNLIKEFRNYTWVTDKEGKPTNKPIDGFNHGIDAIRYALTLPPKTEIFVL